MNTDDELLARLGLDERAGPARRITRDQGQLMVEQALDLWQQELPVRAQRAMHFKRAASAAVVLLALVGGASAARWYHGSAVEAPSMSRPQAQPQARRAAPAAREERAPQDALPPQTVAEPVRARRAPTHDKAEPDDLLQRANRLRAEGRFQDAAVTYAAVYERYPRSLSAYAAQVAAGAIELEHLGKPARARKLFESALRGQPRGALDLEARQGLALALRDLGRDHEEAQALRALIHAHAESPAARRARARLTELESTP